MLIYFVTQVDGFSMNYGKGENIKEARENCPHFKRSKPFVIDLWEADKLDDVEYAGIGCTEFEVNAKRLACFRID